ncbi:MAG: antibiotic biosynthesis monooxygenase [Fluviicola sp. XM-24bin1]|nr:MAG: antibiotic biosynthesis monooxygenase [Fluviicola sp. XM-24bin1]
MITRIVKLEFQEDRTQDFLDFFDTIKHIVNEFPGCYGMKLYQDIVRPNIVMTYSHWDSEASLDKYRDSDQFGQIWPHIKPWFKEKPQAWSVASYFDGFGEKDQMH